MLEKYVTFLLVTNFRHPCAVETRECNMCYASKDVPSLDDGRRRKDEMEDYEED